MQVEQSKFFDMRTAQNLRLPSISPNTIPNSSSLQEPQYQTIKPTKSINNKIFIMSQPTEQKAIEQIIDAYTASCNRNTLMFKDQKVSELISKYKGIVNKGLQNKNPQCLFIRIFCPYYFYKDENTIKKQYSKITLQLEENHKGYPYALMFLGSYKFQKRLKEWQSHMKEAIQYGIGFPFLFYGSALRQSGNYKKAYEMFKNAEFYGMQGAAQASLGQLYYLGGPNFPKNQALSHQYYQKSINKGYLIDGKNKIYYEQAKEFLRFQQQKSSGIIMTNLLQAKGVSQQLSNALDASEQMPHLTPGFSMTSNYTHSSSLGVSMKIKRFYVVFSPLLHLPSRLFLAEDIQTQKIQRVALYGWERIPPSKLKLLHKLGTLVVIHQYIRKFGSQDMIPMYRVEDPSKIEIIQQQQRRCISDEKFRELAKTLFANGYFDQCLPIYQFLIKRDCKEKQIILSNIGLVHEKKNNKNKAIQYYQQSIKTKKTEKAQFRLCSIYINQQLLQKASNILSQMKEGDNKKKLQQLFRQKKTQIDKSANFVSPREIKKPFNRFLYLSNSEMMSLCFKNGFRFKQLHYFFLVNSQKIKSIIGLSSNEEMNPTSYLDTIHQIIKISEKPLEGINSGSVSKIQQFLTLAYHIIIYYSDNADVKLNFIMLIKKFQQKIYDVCNNLKENRCQAEKICQAGKGLSMSLCLRLIKERRNSGKLEQSLNIIEEVMRFSELIDFQLIQNYLYLSLYLEKLKILKKQKKFIDPKSVEKIFQFVQKKTHKQYTQMNYQNLQQFAMKHGASFFYDSQKYQQLIEQVKLQIELEMIHHQILKNNIMEAEKLINQVKKHASILKKKSDSPSIQSIVIYILQIKVAILNKNIKRAYELSDTAYKRLKDVKQLKNSQTLYNFYVKIITKDKLKLVIKQKDLKKIIKESEQAIRISDVNVNYIFKILKQFIITDLEKGLQLLKSLKVSKVLAPLQQQIITDLFEFSQENIHKVQLSPEFMEYIGICSKQIHQFQDYQIEQQQQYQFQDYNFSVVEQIQHQAIDQIEPEPQYEGQVCRFNDANCVNFIVIFDPKLRLQHSLQLKLRIAAQKICKSNLGKNGIKFVNKDMVKLKIRSGARLFGQLKKDRKTYICYFNRLQKHDHYKRK